VSQLVRTQLIEEFGLDPAKAVTLYNGVDLERFHPSSPAERVRFRQMFELETGAPVVAFVGNGFARKGLGPLLEAWPAIKSSPYLLVAGRCLIDEWSCPGPLPSTAQPPEGLDTSR